MSGDTYRVFRVGVQGRIEYDTFFDRGILGLATSFFDYSPLRNGAVVHYDSPYNALQAVLTADSFEKGEVLPSKEEIANNLKDLGVDSYFANDWEDAFYPTEYGDYFTDGFCRGLALELGVEVDSIRQPGMFMHVYALDYEKIKKMKKVHQLSFEETEQLKNDILSKSVGRSVYELYEVDESYEGQLDKIESKKELGNLFWKTLKDVEKIFLKRVQTVTENDQYFLTRMGQRVSSRSINPNWREIRYTSEELDNIIGAFLQYSRSNRTESLGILRAEDVSKNLGRHLFLPSTRVQINMTTTELKAWLWQYSEENEKRMYEYEYTDLTGVNFIYPSEQQTDFLPVTKKAVTQTGNYTLENIEKTTQAERAYLARYSQDSKILKKLLSFEQTEITIPVAGNQNTDRTDLEELAESENPDVRWAVAGNQNTPSSVLLTLSKDSNEFVRNEAFANGRTALDINLVSCATMDANTKASLAVNPSTPTVVLQYLSEDITFKYLLSSNKNTPPEVFYNLAQDVESDEFLQKSLAGNPSTPSSILKDISTCTKRDVFLLLAGNPHTPLGLLLKFKSMSGYDFPVAVCGNPSIPSDILSEFFDEFIKANEFSIVALVAGNVALLEKDKEEMYQKAVQKDSITAELAGALLQNGLNISQSETLALLALYQEELAGIVSEVTKVEKNSLLHKYLDNLGYIPKTIRESERAGPGIGR